jgi:hypothetical protein
MTTGARRPAVVAAALLVALTLGACGSGDETAGTATTAREATRPPATAPPRTATVAIFMPRGDAGPDCRDVLPAPRTVGSPAVLRGALTALLAGPTAAERREGYGGWFSEDTAGALRGVTVRDGVAHVDLDDLRRAIPNASTSCGGALLLAQLDRTATQFGTVRRAVYAFEGDVAAFYEWLGLDAPPLR